MGGNTGPRVDGHPVGVGGTLGHRVETGGVARIGEKFGVRNDAVAGGLCLGTGFADGRRIVVDADADRRTGQEPVAGRVDVKTVGIGKAGTVLSAILLEGEDRTVSAESEDVQCCDIAGTRDGGVEVADAKQ